MTNQKEHWESIYREKPDDDLSWIQREPQPSLEWILDIVPDHTKSVIDVGGGTSVMIDHLLDRGYGHPAVLDISSHALDRAKSRLGTRQSKVDWIEGDVTNFAPSRKFTLWHDRAVFHFLTRREDREKYVESLKWALEPRGFALIGTFSPKGPGQCSGLDVMRFDERSLTAELGPEFKLIRSTEISHITPWATEQSFTFCLFQLLGEGR